MSSESNIHELRGIQYLNNHNMYGKLHERRLNQQDYVMSCEVVRTEMADYVNEEARRVNEDSAKKRAVVQRNIPMTQTWTTMGLGRWCLELTYSHSRQKSCYASAREALSLTSRPSE